MGTWHLHGRLQNDFDTTIWLMKPKQHVDKEIIMAREGAITD